MNDTLNIPAPEQIGITRKQKQTRAVYEVLAGGGSNTLTMIKGIMAGRGVFASETGISARIRYVNRALRLNSTGLKITHRPQKKGSSLMLYQLEGTL